MPIPKIRLPGNKELCGTRQPVRPDAPVSQRLLGHLGLKIRDRRQNDATASPRTQRTPPPVVPAVLVGGSSALDTTTASHRSAGTAPGRHIGTVQRQQIVAHMRDGLRDWKARATSSQGGGGGGLRPDRVMVGLLLDGVFKHHFQSSFGPSSVDSVPTDQTLKAILQEAFGDEHPAGFDPLARETLRTLYRDFDALPHLRDIPRDHRWRLLVDRKEVEALSRQGIDTSNPLLCLVCDGEPRYARQLANGWSFMVKAVDAGRTFDSNLLMEMARACGAAPMTSDGVLYGTTCTKAEAGALVEWMMRLRAEQGIGSFVVVRDDLVLAPPFLGRSATGSAQGTGTRSASNLESAIAAMRAQAEAAWDEADSKTWKVSRNSTSEAKLQRALDTIVQEARTAMQGAASHDERLLAAALPAQHAFLLHPLSDGNSRLAKLALNFLLLSQREPISLIHRSLTVDESRDAERQRVDIVKEGQGWLRTRAEAD